MAIGSDSDPKKEIVGLVPAGGRADRISPIPCSKELFPVGFHSPGSHLGLRPKTVAHYLLEKMRLAGAQKAFFILRHGKWDIPAYFGDGKLAGIPMAYLMMDLPHGVPFTLDQAYSFIGDATVVFGFPDILFQPADAFVQLLNRREETNADVVLGLFPVSQPEKMDMVDLDRHGRVIGISIKPSRTHLRYTWIIAVWGGLFTDFLHGFVTAHKEKGKWEDGRPEVFLGDVIHEAVQKGLLVEKVIFDQGSYLDIGTPEDLAEAVRISNLTLEVR